MVRHVRRKATASDTLGLLGLEKTSAYVAWRSSRGRERKGNGFGGTTNGGDSSLARAVPQFVSSVPAKSWIAEYVTCENNPGGSTCGSRACGAIEVVVGVLL
jgi:hypothetical protein